MKNFYISLLSISTLSFGGLAFAEGAANTSEHFTAEQVGGIKNIVNEYLTEHPELIMTAFQLGMAKQQKEELAKVEQTVKENKDKIFKKDAHPVAGNSEGSESLVIFMDPYCGYCKKFHKELETVLDTNKNVKVTFIDIPIMGEESTLAIQAMFAAKEQGKYNQLQNAIFSANKRLSKKEILKLADSLGIDTKQLQQDMKSKKVKALVDSNSDLAKLLGINGTPTLILGESNVVPGYLSAEDVNKKLKETSAEESETNPEKAS